jgi:RNA polymerase sigma-70 factor, ECF subfamily
MREGHGSYGSVNHHKRVTIVKTGSGSASKSRSSAALLRLAQKGDSRALSSLFRRQQSALRRWARGKLPQWARNAVDTNDLVQEALAHTFRRIHVFQDRGRGALQAYLREAVRNRIRDEIRRLGRQPTLQAVDDVVVEDRGASPFQQAADSEVMRRYKLKLASMSEEEQQLIVGRMEMGYTYEQLALAAGRTVEATRMAVRRAVLKLARKMADT